MADRIEREIEEILRKLDGALPNRPTPRPVKRVGQPLSNAQGWLGRGLARISLHQVMLWSLLTVVASFFLREIPGSSWVMLGALIVFATAFLLSRSRGSVHGQPEAMKRWRGETLDLSSPGWPDRLKAWIKGRRRV